MKHTVATFIAGGQQVLTAFAITLAIFLCACGERGEEPPSAAATPAPTGTVEPTPTTEPTLTPTATPAPSPTEQLAFIGVGGDIWLVNADGSGLRKFASDICEGTGGGSAHYLAWSPAGDKLACFCGDPDQRQSTIVLDETGQVLARIEDALFWGGWSPDGRQIAYTSSLELWEAGGEDVRVLDIVSLQDRAIIEGALVLAWPVSGRLLVGIEVPGEPAGELAKYEANWLDLDTGELERVPRLDDADQFWFSPDGQWAVVLARSQAGVGLAIFDPVTGEEKPIVGSSIGYPGEVIPPYQVAVSPDGSSIYWADAGETPAVIWRARADGSGLTRLGTVPSFFVAVSGHGKVAYLVPGPGGPDSGGTVVIADLERETHTEVSEGFLDLGAAAWRTVTSPSEVTATPEPSPTPGWAERNLDPALVDTLKEREGASEPTAPPTPVWAEPTPEPWGTESERDLARKCAVCIREHPDDYQQVGGCCDYLRQPSAVLEPPRPTPAPGARVYVVEEGDYWASIAGALGVTPEELLEANGGYSFELEVGMELIIPANAIDPDDVHWPTLIDGAVTLKPLWKPGGESYDNVLNTWIVQTIESGWGIQVVPVFDRSPADLVVTFEDELVYDGQKVCGVGGSGGIGGVCYVTLSRWCWDQDFVYEDVPEKTLLHEVGHCMGLGDGGSGVMAIPIQNWPTEEDIRGIHEMYGLD